jgi:hypothetical protein
MITDEAFERSLTEEPNYDRKRVKFSFIAAGILLLILIPIDKDFQLFYIVFGVIIVLVLTLLAAFTEFNDRLVIVADGLVSMVLFVIFEYFAIAAYTISGNYADPIFLLRQFIAVIFLEALYTSVRVYQEIGKYKHTKRRKVRP